MTASSPEQAFADLLAAEPSRPFVTYYDEKTGERSELSVKSLANWVAKTHFLLVDELGLGVGDTAQLMLPAHWISVPIVLGCLSAGLALSADEGVVAFAEPGTVGSVADALDVYVIAPDSAAVGLREGVPDGATDYVVAVRPQADAWAGVRFGAEPSAPIFDGRTRADVMATAVEHAESLGAAKGSRLLTTRDWSTSDDWLDTVLVPLAVGGSLVIVRNAASEDVVERRMGQERATVRV